MSAVTEHVGSRLKALLEGADAAIVEEIYAADAVIWHNTDGIELTRDQLAGMVGALGSVSDCTIEVNQHLPTDEGFVQTQRNIYVLNDGTKTEFDAALVVRLDDSGRIARLDEYLDGAGLAPLIAALG